MCGLAGIRLYDNGPVDTGVLLRMREAMRSRGPDGAGLWCDPTGGVGLAHRRLAILDLSERGAQPMTSADGRLRVVFNGEIYNHPELRAWCEARGARYVSDSDTETLLHLYRLEGKEFVRRLRGMFAFALWDDRERSLLLARDPFGIKPLYYADDGRSLRFASQCKALLAGGVGAGLCPAGVVSFFLWGYVTEPHTWYRSIRALPAGSILSLRSGAKPVIERYADPLDALRKGAATDFEVASLREAMLDSVRHHMLADVPVGVFLSAGIDSGTLCALMRECNSAGVIRGVTLGFTEYVNTRNNEVPLARVVAQRYSCAHDVVVYERGDFEEERARLLVAMDQPTVDGVNTYFVSKAAASTGLKVAISGVGGDELFGGYPSFRQVPRWAHRLHPVPRGLGRSLRRVLAPIVSRFVSPKYAGVFEYGGSISGAYLLRRALFMPWEIPGLVGADMAAAGLEALDVMGSLDSVIAGIGSAWDQVMALEYAVYLRNCLLRDADWAGMAHSLEIRTPLVDATLFAQVATLRRAAGGAAFCKHDWAMTPSRPLPEHITQRAKTGFSVPVREWILGAPGESQVEGGVRRWARLVAAGAQVSS